MNLFIGTVHGFCLRHLLLPYGKFAQLPIPDPLRVATSAEADLIFTTVAEGIYGVNHPYRAADVGTHRRTQLDRESDAWHSEEELSTIAIAYEAALRELGLVDFDDLVVFGQQLVEGCDWVLPIIKAKFPILAVDEYQDLCLPLDRIVRRLVFAGGVRLFAVGDSGLSYVPYISLESVIEQSKEGYYLALRQTQVTIRTEAPNSQPWVTFFLRALQQQMKRLAKKVEREKIVLAALPELSLRIIEHVREPGRVTISDIVRLTGTSRNTLKQHFRQPVAQGHHTVAGAVHGTHCYEVGIGEIVQPKPT